MYLTLQTVKRDLKTFPPPPIKPKLNISKIMEMPYINWVMLFLAFPYPDPFVLITRGSVG
jgi:hypothetical protein